MADLFFRRISNFENFLLIHFFCVLFTFDYYFFFSDLLLLISIKLFVLTLSVLSKVLSFILSFFKIRIMTDLLLSQSLGPLFLLWSHLKRKHTLSMVTPVSIRSWVSLINWKSTIASLISHPFLPSLTDLLSLTH